jgi:hypothetical protein
MLHRIKKHVEQKALSDIAQNEKHVEQKALSDVALNEKTFRTVSTLRCCIE